MESELEKHIFTSNKHIKYWDIRDPKFNKTNKELEVRPIRIPKFRM